jgi:hypothetical protein
MENKEQNTELEQAAENYYLETKYRTPSCKRHFKAGASWQSSQPINSGWVSVEDRLPEKEGYYLCGKQFRYSESFIQCLYEFNFFRMAETNKIFIDEDGITGCFSDALGYGQDVTHWMPLPEAPPKQ